MMAYEIDRLVVYHVKTVSHSLRHSGAGCQLCATIPSVILQPGRGPIDGDHYLASEPGTVAWGWLPNRRSEAVLTIDSGDIVTIDTVSHEGILEDFGRDPVEWFGRHGVAPDDVLTDATCIAEVVSISETNSADGSTPA